VQQQKEMKMIKANTSMVRPGVVIGANTEGIAARQVAKAWRKAGRPDAGYVACGYARNMRKVELKPSKDGTHSGVDWLK
jgi:hypothetical protein